MALNISVVIPVHNSEKYLRACLTHLAQSTLPSFECIVVDDGSTDASADVARRFGAKVLSTGGRRGPAYARNLGAQAASGDLLFFIDSDVCVHSDTLARIRADFESDEQLDALMGSYDDAPGSQDFVSLYRNLMHCFVHQNSREQACTFWSGCGAIRRQLFLEQSGFDESYGRPAIEDIELGYRLFRANKKLMLDKQLQVKHLKRWTLWTLIRTDIWDRGIPWTELILRDRSMPNDLNLQLSQRVSVALVFLLLGGAALLTIYWQGYFLTPLFALTFFLIGRHWVEASDKKPQRAILSLTVAMGLLVCLAYSYHMLGIVPPVVLGYVLLFVRHRYAMSSMKRLQRTGLFLSSYILISVLFILTYLPGNVLMFSFLFGTLVLIALNNQFYLFLASRRGRLFALSAIPLHLLYHFYNGISFIVGVIRYYWRLLQRHSSTA